MAIDLLGFKDVIGKGIDAVSNTIDNLHTSEEEKAQAQRKLMRIENEMTMKAMEVHQKEIEAQKEIIVAEAKSDSWLASSWRPILMLIIGAIVANNYIIYPYLSMFTENATVLELPDKLWNLMQLGVGGYIVGRSGEKVVDKWKNKK